MTEGRTLPSNLQAEESLLGALLLSSRAVEATVDLLTPDDFYKPAHGTIFDAIRRLYADALPIDPVTVSDTLDRMGQLAQVGGPAVVVNLQVATPSTSNAGTYARIVIDAASKRSLIRAASDVLEETYRSDVDAEELVLRARETFADLEVSTTAFLPLGLSTLDDFLDRPPEEHDPWLIPGMLRANWRVMVIAGEGAGKSVLFRQVAISAAAGLHPLTHRRCEPVRSLVVDLENPDEAVEEVCGPMHLAVEQLDDWDPDRCWLWRQSGGINLRSRRDRVELESVLRAARPDVVCIGPMYKAYLSRGKDDEEMATRETIGVLDDLRTRHRFGLLMEHHAPKGEAAGHKRDLRPHGSVLWQRWPELGFTLVPNARREGELRLGRFRGDRVKHSWPEKIERSGGAWPWAGTWPGGTFDMTNPELVDPRF